MEQNMENDMGTAIYRVILGLYELSSRILKAGYKRVSTRGLL